MVRINKYLAECELGSRRGVETLVKEGKVSVNDKIIQDLSFNIDPNIDTVKVDGKIVKQNTKKVFIMLNKPKGYVVTKKDEFNRKTIYNLLPEFAANLHPIGRLDYDSEGLVLLTNDGDITNKIIHPSSDIEKTYKVIIKGKITMEAIQKLREGVEIEGGSRKAEFGKFKKNTSELRTPNSEFSYTTQSAKVFLNNTTDENSELKITISEGKNRQIRKMLEAVDHEVITLKRLQIGEIKLEKLPTGMWRFLKDEEILHLLKTRHVGTRLASSTRSNDPRSSKTRKGISNTPKQPKNNYRNKQK